MLVFEYPHGICGILLCRKLGSDARIPFSPYRHFERKREIFFVGAHERNGRASENGKRRTPYASESRRFKQAGKANGQRKKHPRLCLGGRYEKMLLTHSCLFRCVSQPPPLRGTSFHRKEEEPCPCIKPAPSEKEAVREYRFPVPSFRAKARNLFRLRSIRNGMASENGKHTPCAPRSRCFI